MNGRTYYNEIDPFAAAWLRNLIAAELIPAGDVDERSIKDVQPGDLAGYVQCHFFAGIGGWSYALRLAGWPEDRPVWTGSCPCQPFSAAGKRGGVNDERHLWPEMYRLVRECGPATVFGEQVASKDGRLWLAGVRADLEALGYAVGAADLCAAGVGAPHIRQRLWWVADAPERADEPCVIRPIERAVPQADGRNSDGLADANGGLAGHRGLQPSGQHGQFAQDGGAAERLADADEGQRGRLSDGQGRERHGQATGWQQGHGESEPSGDVDGLEHATGDGRQQRRAESSWWSPAGGCKPSRLGDADRERRDGIDPLLRAEQGDSLQAPWARSTFVLCADGKSRRVPGQAGEFESRIFPLAHGVPNRVGTLRGAGNAIVPALGAEFIGAYLDIEREGYA